MPKQHYQTKSEKMNYTKIFGLFLIVLVATSVTVNAQPFGMRRFFGPRFGPGFFGPRFFGPRFGPRFFGPRFFGMGGFGPFGPGLPFFG